MNFELVLRLFMIGLCVFLMLGDVSRARTPARIRARRQNGDRH